MICLKINAKFVMCEQIGSLQDDAKAMDINDNDLRISCIKMFSWVDDIEIPIYTTKAPGNNYYINFYDFSKAIKYIQNKYNTNANAFDIIFFIENKSMNKSQMSIE